MSKTTTTTPKPKLQPYDRHPYRGKITRVRPTEIVEFGWLRGDVVTVRFFNEVTRVRTDNKGVRLCEVFIEASEHSLDVRTLLETSQANQPHAALIQAAGHAVRGLGLAVPREEWEP